MGTLTIAGIVIGAVGVIVTAVGGVILTVDTAQKTTTKFCTTWKEETEKKINEMNKKH